MSLRSELFHDHLDRCAQCAAHPFALCREGEKLLRGAAEAVPRELSVREWFRVLKIGLDDDPLYHYSRKLEPRPPVKPDLYREPRTMILVGIVPTLEQIDEHAWKVQW